jgi:hypothetical protein
MEPNAGKSKISAESLSADWGGAVLLIWQDGYERPIRRAAVFVFDLPGGGFAWIEPQAWDSAGASSPALHGRPGAKLELFTEGNPGAGFGYEDPERGERGFVYPWLAADLPPVPELEAFYANIATDGLDLKAERERVRPALSAVS